MKKAKAPVLAAYLIAPLIMSCWDKSSSQSGDAEKTPRRLIINNIDI